MRRRVLPGTASKLKRRLLRLLYLESHTKHSFTDLKYRLRSPYDELLMRMLTYLRRDRQLVSREGKRRHYLYFFNPKKKWNSKVIAYLQKINALEK